MKRADRFGYTPEGRIAGYGIAPTDFDGIVSSGQPFRTSGCEGYDGEVACNRPFANSRPGPNLRNYPFQPTIEDLARIRLQMSHKLPAFVADPADAAGATVATGAAMAESAATSAE